MVSPNTIHTMIEYRKRQKIQEDFYFWLPKRQALTVRCDSALFKGLINPDRSKRSERSQLKLLPLPAYLDSCLHCFSLHRCLLMQLFSRNYSPHPVRPRYIAHAHLSYSSPATFPTTPASFQCVVHSRHNKADFADQKNKAVVLYRCFPCPSNVQPLCHPPADPFV